MSFAIMRLEKRNAGNITGMFIHNERKSENHSNEDIDVEKSHLNYQLIECDSYKRAINEQIEKRYKQNRNIRVDAVLGVEVVFTSDNDFFKNLTEEEERKYFEKSLEFLKSAVGEENVISATVHKDESTPHLHCVFVPIDSQGRLRYKSFVNGRNDLIKLQDEYYNYITQDFKNLERGKNLKETKRKHLDVEEYKIESRRKSVELKLEELNSRELELNQKEENIESVNEIIKELENKKTFGRYILNNDDFERIETLIRLNKLEEYRKEKEERQKLEKKLEEKEKEIEQIKNEKVESNKKNDELLNKLEKVLKKNRSLNNKIEEANLLEKKNIQNRIKLEKTIKELSKTNEDLFENLETIIETISRDNKILSDVLREKYKNDWKEKTLYSDIVDSEIRINEINYNIEAKLEIALGDNNVDNVKVNVEVEQEQLLLEKLLLISKIEIYEKEIQKMSDSEIEKYSNKVNDLNEKKNEIKSLIDDFDYETTSSLFSNLINVRNHLVEENEKYTNLRKEMSNSSVPVSSEQSRELTRRIVANNRKIKVINLALKNVNSKMKIQDNQNSIRMTNFKNKNDRFLENNLNRTDNKIKILGVDRIVIEDDESAEEKEAKKVLGKDYRAVRGRGGIER